MNNQSPKERWRKAFFVTPLVLLLSACGGDDKSSVSTSPAAIECDATLANLNLSDNDSQITKVTPFVSGEALPGTDMTAPTDLCLVELTVGPGNPGPDSAPSTSKGIGIEVWLPSKANWNGRFQAVGGGGWVGGDNVISTSLVGSRSEAIVAVENGFASSYTDTGHTATDGDFAMNPDGTINWALWEDFASRGIYHQTIQAQAIISAYYGKSADYSYWNGCSTGGRQGMMMAQRYPDLFDGILAAAPAINWERFIAAELWPQVVMEQDLGGPLVAEQLAAVTAAAITACEEVPGQGYINEPSLCNYDPTLDNDLLCLADGGSNSTSSCLSAIEAQAVNKIWYGPTYDGTAPSPADNNGHDVQLPTNQLWYGLPRGTTLNALAGTNPFPIATDMAAHALQDPRIALPNFENATSNGQGLWSSIDYSGSTPFFYMFNRSNDLFNDVIGTDNPDLREFRDHGGKLILWHGQGDQVIFPQGTINYYERVIDRLGGLDATQKFARLFMVPAVGHCAGNGVPGANPAYPGGEINPNDYLLPVLQEWVEQGEAPDQLNAVTATGTTPERSRPVCLYPKKLTYVGGDSSDAASFECQSP
jgi:feruloyl esterase